MAPEVLLQRQSQRVDLLLSLRASVTRDADDRGEVLRSLWKYIPRVGLLEFKSVARLFARGDLYRPVALGKLAQSIPLRIRLEGVKPEEVLAALPPEDRLAGLTPETIARALSEADHVLALPDAALRGLSPEYVATLPEAARARIRERLAR